VPRAGLEPARPYEHYALNVACLPISAPRHGVRSNNAAQNKSHILAGAEGFEPPAAGFGDQCSSQTELRSCADQTTAKYIGRRLSPASNHTLMIASLKADGLCIFIRFLSRVELKQLPRGLLRPSHLYEHELLRTLVIRISSRRQFVLRHHFGQHSQWLR
jgi:hypothetical protein